MVAGATYPALIRVRRDRSAGPDGSVLCYTRADNSVTPRGREAGEIPAQSRYGERPARSASPVADLTVHARTFERKVGRTVRLHRLRPLVRPVSKRGVRDSRAPPTARSARRFPCPAVPSPPVRAPRARRASPLDRLCPAGGLVLAIAACTGGSAASRRPASPPSSPPVLDRRAPTPAPTASPTPPPAFPTTLTDDEGTAVKLAGGAAADRLADAGRDRDPVRPRRRAAGRRHDRLRRLPAGGGRPARCGQLHRGRRREDRRARGGPGHRRWQLLQPARGDRPARDRSACRWSSSTPRTRRRARRHRADRQPRSDLADAAADDDRHDAGRLRRGRRRHGRAGARHGRSTSSTPPSAIYTAADGSFVEEMVALAGGDPITTGSPTDFAIPLEKLIDADPELILLGDAAYGVTAGAGRRAGRLERDDAPSRTGRSARSTT